MLSISAAAVGVLLAGCGGGGGGRSSALPATVTTASALAAPPAFAPSSPGVPTVAQVGFAGTDGNTTSLAATLPNVPAPGSYLVAFVATGDATTQTAPPSGWAAAVDPAGHACRTTGPADTQGEQVFVHRVAPQEHGSSYAFSFSANNSYALGVVEVRNVSAARPISACAGTQPPTNSSTGWVAGAKLGATAAGQLPLIGYAPSTTGLTVTPKSGWTNNTYSAPQTQYMTLDTEYGPVTTGAMSVAPSTTFGNLGGPTIVFAPSVALLLGPGAGGPPNPTPAPSASPSPRPTPTPAPGPRGNAPYSASSPWNRQIASNPALLPNSDAIISRAYSTSAGPWVRLSAEGSGWNEGHPVYFATNADPVVSANCTLYCIPGAYPATFHIPANARPGDGGDGHIAVVQPDGTEIDTWASVFPSSDWSNGATFTTNTINACGNYYTGSGMYGRDTASTVGGTCLAGGMIKYSEIKAGVIPHALFTWISCGDQSSYVYPAYQPIDNVCQGSGPHIPNGAHVWLDTSDGQINALPLAAWEKTVLVAMHHYGAFVADTAGGSLDHADTAFVPVFEDDSPYVAAGKPNPLLQWASGGNGWNPQTIGPNPSSSAPNLHDTTWYSWQNSDSAGWNPLSSIGGWAAHLHIVAPCYGQGTC